ncbi:MAG: adenylate/guanylate cyclase domain-containing protein [Saccharospirillaceae bacterium]|nr:adenylate/guanylate cyclase domain-containing protein [Pseudomonadales bacterium]NRB80938.1 adenylate/guanylate cyclase domain-containing protein [Saccharospirillaceae bacterium]
MLYSQSAQQLSQWHLLKGRLIEEPSDYLNQFIKQLNNLGYDIQYCVLNCKILKPSFKLEIFNWINKSYLKEDDLETLNQITDLNSKIFDYPEAITFLQTITSDSIDSKVDSTSPLFDNYGELQSIKIDPNELEHPLGLSTSDQELPENISDIHSIDLQTAHAPTNVFTLATSLENGFSAEQETDFQLIGAIMASFIGDYTHQLIINQFMSVYLGREIADEILKGQMARGDVQEIEAAIWFSNIKLPDQVGSHNESKKHIANLNTYYHSLIKLIESNNGHVLKFMGDGILAMFEGKDSCHLALEAAVESLKIRSSFEHSVSLNYGKFDFGNIGSENRMDFTALGSEINLTSKIQAQASFLGCALLGSDTFANKVSGCLKPLGYYRLEGWKPLQQLHCLISFEP